MPVDSAWEDIKKISSQKVNSVLRRCQADRTRECQDHIKKPYLAGGELKASTAKSYRLAVGYRRGVVSFQEMTIAC